jgi:hypothetical protein
MAAIPEWVGRPRHMCGGGKGSVFANSEALGQSCAPQAV